MNLQKLEGAQGRFLNITKSICKNNSYTGDGIIKRARAGKREEFLFIVSFFMLFQVSRHHVQAVSVLLYFRTRFLCLAFCFICLMDLEPWHPFVLKFPESACLLQPGPGTSSKHRPEHGTKKTPETRKARGYLRGNRTFTLFNICGPAQAGLGMSNLFKCEKPIISWHCVIISGIKKNASSITTCRNPIKTQ